MQRTRNKIIRQGSTQVSITEDSSDIQFMERRIITGMVVSTDYILQIRKIYKEELISNSSARMIAGWCISYFDKYRKAPGKEIESIFVDKTKNLQPKIVEDIEDILAGLSDEYEHQEMFNVQYLIDQTNRYLQEQNVDEFILDLKDQLDKGEIDKVIETIYNFKHLSTGTGDEVDLGSAESKQVMERAFNKTSQSVLSYPYQLGDFLNAHLIRGGFIGFMAPEKRGKTWWMIDMAIRGAKGGANVAFFQAGDMTTDQFMKRVAIYLTRKSDNEKYTGVMYEPRRDCFKNQFDTCDKDEREAHEGLFDEDDSVKLHQLSLSDLIDLKKKNPDYSPCTNCSLYWKNKWGATWLEKVKVKSTLTMTQATQALDKYFIQHKRRLKVATYANGTLSVTEMETVLDKWEREANFIPDIIIVDYADILASELKSELRHQENDKWKRLRALSQKKHALVITATQTDANSYDRDLISLKNYSEDKRKYGHVTAMYGLNQDRAGREKEIGILRINQVLLREEGFSNSNQITILQNLRRGIPMIESYFTDYKK